jgi:phage/plasmid-like protein (TIGR03299 family)
MSHNLAEIKGDVAFFAGRNIPPWHHLGVTLNGVLTWKEAVEKSNLNWKVEKKPLYNEKGEAVPIWGVFRDVDNAFLGSVGERYETIQNSYAFEFVDALIGDNLAHYDSAGALGKGEVIFCSAYLPSANYEIVAGDEHQTYLLFKTSHDGSMSAICKLTDVRVVCNNTLTQALKAGGSNIKVQHTRNAQEKLNLAKNLITGSKKKADEIRDKMRELSKKKVTKESMKNILSRLFPSNDEGELATRTKNNISDLLNLYESNDKNIFPEIRGTAYNLLNACTEYADKIKSIKNGNNIEKARAESSLFGGGEKFKNEAMSYILKESESMPNMVKNIVTTFEPPKNEALQNIFSMVDI